MLFARAIEIFIRDFPPEVIGGFLQAARVVVYTFRDHRTDLARTTDLRVCFFFFIIAFFAKGGKTRDFVST